MQLEWRDELTLGVPELDAQHREFITRINALLTACTAGKGGKEVAPVAAFLEDYVVHHFTAEERLMATHGYPALASHQQLHAWFRSQYKALKVELQRGPSASPMMALKLNQLLVKWFTEHISGQDRAFADFLARKGPVAPPAAR